MTADLRRALTTEHLDTSLIREGSGQSYLAAGWMPLRTEDNGTRVIATTFDPDSEFLRTLADRYHQPISVIRTTEWELRAAVVAAFDELVADSAANSLFERQPDISAKRVLSRPQAITTAITVAFALAALVLWPVPTLTVGFLSLSAWFAAGVVFKFVVSLRGARFDVLERSSREELIRLSDAELPVYTVLVPVFREANIVAQLVQNLGGLDYPTDKLEVIILTEAADEETREAFARADPPDYMHVVTVPAGDPQTKPRACNVGLDLATGEYLVIYDAEDKPEPDQLKKAFLAFRRNSESVICVQAALNYFNANENVLTRMFTLEYSYWFDYMLAGLDASALPIPLGGTSNHFRTEALRELGGWDPYNVTEDADLGIRASAKGYRVGVIDSTTMEEANTSIPNFIRQRSRWIKGYMQTSLVHARHPIALTRQIGLRSFVSFSLLITGTPMTFLAVIPLGLLTAYTILAGRGVIVPFIPAWASWVCLLSFVLSNWITVYLSMMGPYRRKAFDLVLWSFLTPIYWLLHSISSYKALWQLLTRPHFWEKTEHGLTKAGA